MITAQFFPEVCIRKARVFGRLVVDDTANDTVRVSVFAHRRVRAIDQYLGTKFDDPTTHLDRLSKLG